MIRILQGNMNRSRTADHLLHQLVVEKGAELLILSEQYRNKESTYWYSDLLHGRNLDTQRKSPCRKPWGWQRLRMGEEPKCNLLQLLFYSK